MFEILINPFDFSLSLQWYYITTNILILQAIIQLFNPYRFIAFSGINPFSEYTRHLLTLITELIV